VYFFIDVVMRLVLYLAMQKYPLCRPRDVQFRRKSQGPEVVVDPLPMHSFAVDVNMIEDDFGAHDASSRRRPQAAFLESSQFFNCMLLANDWLFIFLARVWQNPL